MYLTASDPEHLKELSGFRSGQLFFVHIAAARSLDSLHQTFPKASEINFRFH